MNEIPIWISRLPRIEPWDYHYNDLYNQCLNYVGPWMSNNLPIKDPTGVWDKLYQQFLDKAQEILGPLEILSDNSRTCWLYMMNKNFYKGGIHHHKDTSTVNAVYYFAVPESESDRDAAIAFYDNNNNEISYYKPKECDLLIFPNYLLHQPLPTISEKHRFAINMEIKCEWPERFNMIP